MFMKFADWEIQVLQYINTSHKWSFSKKPNDSTHGGEEKVVNLLSLSPFARVYSGLNSGGNRLKDYPYSPLSAGNEKAVYKIVECPDADDPRLAEIDVNSDGYSDFSYKRTDTIPYYDHQANLAFAPPLINDKEFSVLLQKYESAHPELITNQLVLTRKQYATLSARWPSYPRLSAEFLRERLVWLKSAEDVTPFFFNPQCQVRGQIVGTSLIPPMKVREILPGKQKYASGN